MVPRHLTAYSLGVSWDLLLIYLMLTFCVRACSGPLYDDSETDGSSS
jgi:hypothetical protein